MDFNQAVQTLKSSVMNNEKQYLAKVLKLSEKSRNIFDLSG